MRAQVCSYLFTETIRMGGVWASQGFLKTLCRVNKTFTKRLNRLSYDKRGDGEPCYLQLKSGTQKKYKMHPLRSVMLAERRPRCAILKV